MVTLGALGFREKLINLVGSLYLLRRKQENRPHKAGITVLNYHKISAFSFRKHLDYIGKYYQILSPESFLNWLDDEATIDKPSVVLTFDDAYLSFYEEIYPILKETEMRVLMFVPTGFVGKTGYFWVDELQVALQKTSARVIVVDNKRFFLYSRLYRGGVCEKIIRTLHFLDEESRSEIMEDLLMELNVTITENDMVGYRFLSWPQIAEMGKSGLVVFGSHTVSHPNLTFLSDGPLKFELQESRRILENRTRKPVSTLAYPYGGLDFFDRRVIDEAKKAGYSHAFTTVQGGIENKEKERFRLRRVMLFDYQSEGAVALKLDRFGT
jgi:peptidoglycan/xylan/chitin deacetylase (PgdA/CDA1 family)